MGNGISTATRSRVAVCIATLLIVIGFSSPAFAKEGFVSKAVPWIDPAHKFYDLLCPSSTCWARQDPEYEPWGLKKKSKRGHPYD
jgi:hypothetical protein